MRDATKLTARQQQILQFVEQRIACDGVPPTRVEIADAFGFKSANAAEEHLRALARKGVLEIRSGSARGIRLTYDVNMPPLLTLPLIGRVPAGKPILAQECVERQVRVDSALFPQTPDYLLRVRGTSMIGAGIFAGDLLAARRPTEVRSGHIIVARIAGEVTVRRFFRTRQGVELHAENPNHLPIVIDGSEEFTVEGVAVGLLRCGEI